MSGVRLEVAGCGVCLLVVPGIEGVCSWLGKQEQSVLAVHSRGTGSNDDVRPSVLESAVRVVEIGRWQGLVGNWRRSSVGPWVQGSGSEPVVGPGTGSADLLH